jgi:uncharacterized protein YdeI (YjbR/CyaY-like superfamily)
MDPKFFATSAGWRRWLERHHNHKQELLVGFYTKDSGKPSITWLESVDGALCFGWIDGVRRRIDDVSYSIRFTPRRPRSAWSAINTKRAGELMSEGLMHPAGIKAFEARREDRSGIYSFEQKNIDFDTTQKKQFQANQAAWSFLFGAAAMVSPDRHLVGHQREAAGNQGQALGRPYRRFGARPDDSPVDPATEAETVDMLTCE